jgi:cytochrome c peroxidase
MIVRRSLCFASLGLLAALACKSEASLSSGSSRASLEREEGAQASAAQAPAMFGREPIEALSAPPELDPRLVSLGRKLFNDTRLSADDSVSCASCHDLQHAGVDGKPRSVGIHGQAGSFNAPTVYNSGLNFAQFWDGRARTLEEQVDGPVLNAVEMGSTWDQVTDKLRRDPDYRARFSALFSGGVTPEGVRRALAAFERTLVGTDSPFDQWLAGQSDALTPQQKTGYELFKSTGCIACHQGRNVGGNMMQRFGVFGDYLADRGNVGAADYGRFNVTGNEADRFVFRVPSLRYASVSAPYFHDGSADTLTRAVQVMAKYQLGRTLLDEQVTAIVAFLGSLAGPTPASVHEP